jgi:hypothetical protein
MLTESFETFRTRSLAAGADEVLERRWKPGEIAQTHTHPFHAQALVAEGEMWLTCDGETRHLAAGTPHAERYGPQGAVYWVARRNTR